MGHANNSRFLTYCESARIDYWEAATGEPFGLATHGESESMILAEIRVTFRSPAYFGELLTVESRLGRIGRTSFTLEHRVTAPESARGAGPARRDGRGRPGAVRLRDGAARGPSPTSSSHASRPSRAARSAADRGARRAVRRLRLEAAEDRDRVLAAEAEAVDRDRVDLRLARDERHVVEVALGVRACAGSRSAR